MVARTFAGGQSIAPVRTRLPRACQRERGEVAERVGRPVQSDRCQQAVTAAAQFAEEHARGGSEEHRPEDGGGPADGRAAEDRPQRGLLRGQVQGRTCQRPKSSDDETVAVTVPR